MKLRVAWGSKYYNRILWPNEEAPAWANTAARRMTDMGIDISRINEILAEMRKVNLCKVYKLNDAEYEVIFE